MRSWYISSSETTTSEKRQDAIKNIIYYYTNIINGVSSTAAISAPSLLRIVKYNEPKVGLSCLICCNIVRFAY